MVFNKNIKGGAAHIEKEYFTAGSSFQSWGAGTGCSENCRYFKE